MKVEPRCDVLFRKSLFVLKKNWLEIVSISKREVTLLEELLEVYDEKRIKRNADGTISIGMRGKNDRLIAGLDATMTSFDILYVSTVFVDQAYRRRQLILKMEKQAQALGAHTIRLDTFDRQGSDFYRALDYQEVGFYHHKEDDYAEHFFVKFLN